MLDQQSRRQSCIDECLRCYQVCLGTASGHCLDVGDRHVQADHMRLILACAELCRTSAAILLIGTIHHKAICRECATLCDDCAKYCRTVGGMEACIAACDECAASCLRVAA